MRRRILIIVGGVVLALGLAGGAFAVSAQDDEAPASGPEAERAAAAAVEHAGGGRAVEVERDPEGTRVWKVEVAKEGGALVDVELDAELKVVTEADDAGEAPEADETEAQDAAEDTNEGPDDDQDGADDQGDDQGDEDQGDED
mgnify:CR=1 FL=1